MKRIICILTLSLALIVKESNGDKEGCEPMQIFACFSDMSVLQDLKFAYQSNTEEALDKVCGPLQTSLQCFQDFIKRCKPPTSVGGSDGITKAIEQLNEICTKGSELRSDVLATGPCMNKIQETSDTCAPKGLNDPKKSQKEKCCTYYNFLTCSEDALTSKCGPRSVNVFRKLELPSRQDLQQYPMVCVEHRRACGYVERPVERPTERPTERPKEKLTEKPSGANVVLPGILTFFMALIAIFRITL